MLKISRSTELQLDSRRAELGLVVIAVVIIIMMVIIEVNSSIASGKLVKKFSKVEESS